MSNGSREKSAQGGEPVLLFHFAQGSRNWRYTNASMLIRHQNADWNPAPISVDSINISEEISKNTVRVTLPRDNDLALELLKAPVSAAPTTLTIFRGHLALQGYLEETLTYWKGRVISASASGSTITLDCEPVFTNLKVYGLRARFQRTCRFALYSFDCGASLVSETLTLTSAVTMVEYRYSAPTLPNDWLTGGMIVAPDGTRIYIVEQNNGRLRLIRPSPSLFDAVKESSLYRAQVYPGCDHTIETCRSKFNNVRNFGGFPWIPVNNPFDGAIE